MLVGSLEAVFALTLVPRERQRRDESQVWSITSGSTPEWTHVYQQDQPSKDCSGCPPHRPFRIRLKNTAERELREKNSGGEHRTFPILPGRTLTRSLSRRSSLRSTALARSNNLEKLPQKVPAHLTFFKPYQRPSLRDHGSQVAILQPRRDPVVLCSVLILPFKPFGFFGNMGKGRGVHLTLPA